MAAALQSYHDTICFLQKIEDLEYKVASLEGEKRSLVELLNAFVYHSQDQSSKSVAAAVAAQKAARKACEATDLQHEAAQSHMRACGELKRSQSSSLRLAQLQVCSSWSTVTAPVSKQCLH